MPAETSSEQTPQEAPSILAREDGATIAHYRRAGKAPCVVFLGGFMSDMTGIKARFLDRFCTARGQAFLRFDYFGHGASSGEFAAATVGRWKEDSLAVIDALTAGPLVLVGSSLGGWLMLLAGLARPQRIRALIGIAAAPDATENLMWRRFSPDIRAEIETKGAVVLPSAYSETGYLITRRLIEEGRRHLVMGAPIPLSCPVRLIHGMQDKDVPWQTSLDLAERLAGSDVQVMLVKDGDHRLSREGDLALLQQSLAPLLD